MVVDVAAGVAPCEGEEFEVVLLKGGARSIRSRRFGETMHIGSGPRSEALTLHVEQQRIVERVGAWKDGAFVLWDVGLGPAGNALTTLERLKEARAEGAALAPVEIHSFEISTAILEFALRHVGALEYLAGWEAPLEALLCDGEAEPLPGVRWVLHRGDFAASVLNAPPTAAIFHDPYSPAKNPEMWSVELFRSMRERCEGMPTLLTNYTRSTAIRATLALAGWVVGVGAPTGDKDETTIAATHSSLLELPLGREWLGRVERSVNAAPFRGGVYAPGPMSEADLAALRALGQFAVESK